MSAVAAEPALSARTAAPADPAAPSRVPGSRQKVLQALRRGATVNAAAAQAGIPADLAGLMVDEMRRLGLLDDATSLCASGLGACHAPGGLDGVAQDVRVHCAGCPLVPLAPAPSPLQSSSGGRRPWRARRRS